MAKRRNFSAQFKAKVALEALRGERTQRSTSNFWFRCSKAEMTVFHQSSTMICIRFLK